MAISVSEGNGVAESGRSERRHGRRAWRGPAVPTEVHIEPRNERLQAPSFTSSWQKPRGPHADQLKQDALVDCGWGRLIFAHTFDDPAKLAATLRDEREGTRDIAIYLRDPHVVVSQAPQELFLDPSHTYRLMLSGYRAARGKKRAFVVRRLQSIDDAHEMNRLYAQRRMVPADASFLWDMRLSKEITHFVAEDKASGEIIGTVTGIDHVEAMADPEGGCSLWCLAVSPDTQHPGVGEALARFLAEFYLARGHSYVDLSVLHDNKEAIALYEKLGFFRVPVFALKRKNPINERFYSTPAPDEELNIYAQIIIDEARRRGLGVTIVDAEAGYFSLEMGGRSILCRESLSELTTAVAMSRCDDKRVTRRLLERGGLKVPAQQSLGKPQEDAAFLELHGPIVVKPARGEQGQGVTVDVRTPEEMKKAVTVAKRFCPDVLLEKLVDGMDLRVVVIDRHVVAAAVRSPPVVTGTGKDSVRELIKRQSRRRKAATKGEASIPLDAETERCVRAAGHGLDDVLPDGATIAVRRTANLHSGGTIHDVTAALHPTLAEAAVRAAELLDIPVVGLDFIVPDIEGEDYVIIEANERPGLANHEPQPTAQKFVDLLFPQSAGRS